MRIQVWGGWSARRARSLILRAARRVGNLDATAVALLADVGVLDRHLANTEVAIGYLPHVAFAIWWSTAALLNLEDLLRRRLGAAYRPGVLADLLARRESTTAAQTAMALEGLAVAAGTEARSRAFMDGLGLLPEGREDAAAPAADWQSALGARAGGVFAEFLRQYGHHSAVDAELAEARWSEDPGRPLRAAARSIAEPLPARGDARERSRAAWASIRGRLSLWDRFRCRRMVGAVLAGARLQDAVRAILIRQVALERRLCLDAGTRLAANRVLPRPEDVFFLNAAEMRALLLSEDLGTNLRALVERRRHEHEMHTRQPVGLDGDEGVGPVTGGSGEGPLWVGVGVSGGTAEGSARILRSPDDGWDIGPGDIVVAERVETAWAPHLLRAGGLVLSGGGVLSQGALIARGAGIPAVAGVRGALERIPDRARLLLDGTQGTVELLG